MLFNHKKNQELSTKQTTPDAPASTPVDSQRMRDLVAEAAIAAPEAEQLGQTALKFGPQIVHVQLPVNDPSRKIA